MSERGSTRAGLLGAIVVLLALTGAVWAQSDDVAVGPVPDWVDLDEVSLAAADVPADEISGGVYYLLSSRQVNRISDPPVTFAHTAWYAENNVGVQDRSQISVDFDPTFETLTFHFVRVRRNGEILDRLRPEQIRVIQPERRIEQQIYDGTLTALLVLEDVRPGDVIEYAYSRAGAKPVLAGHFTDSVSLGFSVPVDRVRYRLLWPEGRPPSMRKVNTDAEAVIDTVDGGISYEWTVRRPPPIDPPYDVPGWYDPYPWIQLTDFESWNDVAVWGDALFARSDQLSPDVQDEVARIAARHDDPEARVLAALRFVQDEIRYFAISLGSGSYEPSEPGVVLDRRFGDCKDKSCLLVGMLRALGVEADVAFVGTGLRRKVADWRPSVSPFDHVIVRVTHDGEHYWVDPTNSQARGSLAASPIPDYGRALLIDEATTDLTPVTRGPATNGHREITATFRALQVGKPVTMTVRTVYHGFAADNMRYVLAQGDRGEYTQNARDYYGGMYPSIESLETVSVEDDETTNVLVTTEKYTIPDFWTWDEARESNQGEFYPLEIANLLSAPSRPQRDAPLAVPYPTDVRYSTRVHLTDGGDLEPEHLVLDNDGFVFTYDVTPSPHLLQIDYTVRTKGDHVASAAAVEYADDIERMEETLSYVIEYWDGSILMALLPFIGGVCAGILFVLTLLIGVIIYRHFGRSVDAPVAPHHLTGVRGLLRAAFTIWFEPRATIRRVHSVNTTWQVLFVMAVAGVFSLWDQASFRAWGDHVPMAAILIGGAMLGPILSLIRFYIVTYALTWIGSMMGGRAEARHVRTVVGYGNLIYLWLSLTWIPTLLLMGEEVFTTEMPRTDSSMLLQGFNGLLVGLALSMIVWQIVVILKGLSEVNGFSIWRALLVGFVTAILLIVALVLLVAVIVLPFALAMASGRL